MATKKTEGGGVLLSGESVSLAPTRKQNSAGKFEVTKVDGVVVGSTFTPELLEKEWRKVTHHGLGFQILALMKLDLVRRVNSGEIIRWNTEDLLPYFPKK